MNLPLTQSGLADLAPATSTATTPLCAADDHGSILGDRRRLRNLPGRADEPGGAALPSQILLELLGLLAVQVWEERGGNWQEMPSVQGEDPAVEGDVDTAKVLA